MTTAPDISLGWGHSALALVVDVAPDGPVAVRTLTRGATPHPARATQPLVEVLVAGTGRARASHRFAETAIGRRLAYTGSAQKRDGAWHELRIDLRDEQTDLAAQTLFRSSDGVGACQVSTRITNQGPEAVLLLGVTSFATGLLGCPVDGADLVHADSEWLGEGRWRTRPLRDVAADLNLRLLGPTDLDHQWQHRLEPGESFTTVPVSVAVSTANTFEVVRAPGFDKAGEYNVAVTYTNAELGVSHAYNPQVIECRLEVTEAGGKGGTAHAYFRYTYAWDSFLERTVPVRLTTADRPLVFGNPNAYAPDIDKITIAPIVVGRPTTVAQRND